MKCRGMYIILFVLLFSVASLVVSTVSSGEDENETELPNGRTIRIDRPLSEQVNDLNGDGARNILDLVLEINGG